MTSTTRIAKRASSFLAKSPLAGSEWVDHAFFEHGIKVTWQLVPFQHTLGDVQRLMPKVASGMEWPLEQLIVEPHPRYPKNPSIIQLTIVTESPIEGTIWFDRPRFIDGFIQLGPYADGVGEAFFRLYSEYSMHSGFVLAAPGFGKSRLLESIAITAMAMGNTIVFYIDGQNGASSRTLFKHADWAVGIEGAPTMMAALERAAAWRQAELRVDYWNDGGEGFTPSPQRPGILVIIDEQHRIAPLFPERLGFAASEWRKVGQALLGADQESALKTAFANENRIRTGMLSGNGFAMHTPSRVDGNLIPGLETHPADLPKIPGYAVRVAAAGSTDPDGEPARSAPFRSRYSPNAKGKAKAEANGERVPVPTIEEWFERHRMPEMDRGTARAMGDDYRLRYEAQRKTLDEVRALVNATDEEFDRIARETVWIPSQRADRQQIERRSMAITTTTSTTTTTRVEMTEEVRSFVEQIRELDWDGGLDLGTLMSQFPKIRLGVARPAIESLVIDGELVKDKDGTQDVYRKALPRGSVGRKTTTREAILALTWGPNGMTRGQIIAALPGCTEPSVDQALRAMCTANPPVLVKEPGRGKPYRLA